MSTFRPPPTCPPDSEPTLPSSRSPVAPPYRASAPTYDVEPDPFPPAHRYTSTACLHGAHGQCRLHL